MDGTSAALLIVEDDQDIAEAIRDLLEEEGFSVARACDGQEALNYLGRCAELPRLILLDLMMPGMDGFAFREAQRADPRLASVPVVVMTANAQADAKREALQVDEILKKPMGVDVLVKVVGRYCGRSTSKAANP